MKQYILNLLVQLKDAFIATLTTISIFLAPINELIFAAIMISILDLLTALAAAKKHNVPITSKRFGDTIPKLILYSLFIICMHYLDTHFIAHVRDGFLDHVLALFMEQESIDILSKIKLTAGAAVLITIRELISIDENWEKNFGWSFVRTIKDNLISVIERFKPFLQTKTKKDGDQSE